MKTNFNEDYKGFAITFIDNGTDPARFFVEGAKFNGDGYATLNGAKGAITKHINAQEAAQAKAEEVAATLPYPVESVPPATVMGVACNVTVTAGDVVAAKSAARIDGMVEALEAAPLQFTVKKDDKGFPIHSDPRMAKIFAEMVYLGMVKQRDTRSRNKREGRYAGKFDGQQYRTGKREYYPGATFPSWEAAFDTVHGVAPHSK